MALITFLKEGPGFLLMIAVLTGIFLGALWLIRRSSLREYTGRLVIPVFFMELAVVFAVMTLGLRRTNSEVGAGVVPGLWITAIFILSLLLLILAALGKEEKDPPWNKIGSVAVMIGAIVLYLVLMQYIGYALASILFLVFSMVFLSYRSWKVIASITVGWILFSYFAFYRLLYVPLPKGRLIEWIFG